MKTRLKPILLLTTLACLTNSCGQTNKKTALVPEVSNQTKLQTEGTEIITTEANIEYRVERKTVLSFDGEGNITNRNQFVEDLNKRILTVTSLKTPLKNGIVKCMDVTNPTEVAPFEKPLENDFTSAQFELSLNPQVNKMTKIECHLQVSDGLLNNSSSIFNITPDLYIDGVKSYNQAMLLPGQTNKISALVLEENSVLVTKGEDLKINVETLVSLPHSEIKTFLDSETYAASGVDGHAGGKLEIASHLTTGTLSLNLNGQNGGYVKKVDDITSYPDDYSQEKLDGVHEQGEMVTDCGNMKNRIERDGSDRCNRRTYYLMKVAPTSGLPGLTGLRGNDGLNGRNGGDSGTYSLTLKKMINFNLETSINPGKASSPSQGGKGGPGTPGGRIFCRDLAWCQAHGVTAGSKGRDGIRGKDGLPGLDGRKLNSEFNILK